ncbi:MAG: ABC transporter substrate-binding protein, partial [Pseudonocardiaceae bacterium]|nr:ABC transporter substrate-binding protein [Pseudonocardiaceae bacterium]
NADAVIFNVQRHIDDPSSPGNLFAKDIESMRAVDPLTVEFALASPNGEFPVAFAAGWTYGMLGIIGSPRAIREAGDDYTRSPVGAGPHRFVEWVEDSRIVLERNENYWQEGKPYLDRIEFRPLSDTESRYASLENGDVDMIFAGYHTELIRAMDNPNLDVYYGPGNGAEWMYFNHQDAPFDDRRMREAVVRAVNLDALSATQFRGRMERADSIFGRDSEYYSPQAAQRWPDYDPERARQLIEEFRADGGDT